jgi:hypothetical protein
MVNKIFPPKKDLYPNGICPKHLKKLIPCIEKNPQGCITPHPNPGVHVVYMCPNCWEDWQERKKKSGFRW